MTLRSNLTYAGVGWSAIRRSRRRPRPSRYRLQPAWHRLDASVRGRTLGTARPLLSLPLRLLVTALLVGICLAVLSKEPALRDDLAEYTGTAWEGLSGWIASWRPAPLPAAAAPAPHSLEPAVSMAAPEPREVKPLALISDGGVFILGADGSVWPNRAEVSPDRFPIVTGAGVAEVPGPMGVRLQTRVDVGLLRRILAAPFSDQLSEINLSAADEIVLYARDGAKIKLDNGLRLDRDLRRLEAILADLRSRNVSAAVIDLRYSQQAVVRPRP
jgi:hypothetical protein